MYIENLKCTHIKYIHYIYSKSTKTHNIKKKLKPPNAIVLYKPKLDTVRFKREILSIFSL